MICSGYWCCLTAPGKCHCLWWSCVTWVQPLAGPVQHPTQALSTCSPQPKTSVNIPRNLSKICLGRQIHFNQSKTRHAAAKITYEIHSIKRMMNANINCDDEHQVTRCDYTTSKCFNASICSGHISIPLLIFEALKDFCVSQLPRPCPLHMDHLPKRSFTLSFSNSPSAFFPFCLFFLSIVMSLYILLLFAEWRQKRTCLTRREIYNRKNISPEQATGVFGFFLTPQREMQDVLHWRVLGRHNMVQLVQLLDIPGLEKAQDNQGKKTKG